MTHQKDIKPSEIFEGENRWFMSYELVSRDIYYKDKPYWIGPSGDRIARYMAEDGRIERLGRGEHSGKYAKYRALQEPKQTSLLSNFAIHTSQRTGLEITSQ